MFILHKIHSIEIFIYGVLAMEIKKNRKIEIENQTEELFKEVGYDYNSNSNIAIDIIYIVKKLGFKVGSALLNNDNDDGFIIVQEGKSEILGIKTDKLIGVNSNRNLKWKRFIIAHELAHYKLHYNQESDAGMYAHREHRKGKDNEENEADYFAANILMPADKFKAEYNKIRNRSSNINECISELSNLFIVTDKMVERRISELELEMK